MSSPLRPTRIRRAAALRGVVASAALLCTVLTCTAGCGSGFDAASLNVKPDSASAQLGGIKINDVVVVADPATGNAEVLASVANTGQRPEQLVVVAANGLPATVRPAAATEAAVTPPGETATVSGNTVTIPAGSAVSFGQPGRPELEISDGSFKPGWFAQVQLGFANTGQAAVNAQIMPNTGLYEGYNPNGPNTPSSPGGAASPSGSGSASASPSASPTSSTGTVSTTGHVLRSTPSPTPSSTASPTSAPVPTSASGPSSSSSPAPSAADLAPAKASTTLARTPHLHGSREPRP